MKNNTLIMQTLEFEPFEIIKLNKGFYLIYSEKGIHFYFNKQCKEISNLSGLSFVSSFYDQDSTTYTLFFHEELYETKWVIHKFTIKHAASTDIEVKEDIINLNYDNVYEYI